MNNPGDATSIFTLKVAMKYYLAMDKSCLQDSYSGSVSVCYNFSGEASTDLDRRTHPLSQSVSRDELYALEYSLRVPRRIALDFVVLVVVRGKSIEVR